MKYDYLILRDRLFASFTWQQTVPKSYLNIQLGNGIIPGSRIIRLIELKEYKHIVKMLLRRS